MRSRVASELALHYQVASGRATPAQPNELPDDKGVSRCKSFQASAQGRAVAGGAGNAVVLEDGFASGLSEGGELQGRRLVVRRNAGVADFHGSLLH